MNLLTLIRFAHAALWHDDRRYRLAWLVWPQATAIILVMLLQFQSTEHGQQTTAPWSRPIQPTAGSPANPEQRPGSGEQQNIAAPPARPQTSKKAPASNNTLESVAYVLANWKELLGSKVEVGYCTIYEASRERIRCAAYEGTKQVAEITLVNVQNSSEAWALKNCAGNPTPTCTVRMTGVVGQFSGSPILKDVTIQSDQITEPKVVRTTPEPQRPPPSPLQNDSPIPGSPTPYSSSSSLNIPQARSGAIRYPSEQAPLKLGPDVQSSTIETLPNKTPVWILEDTGAWYRVQAGNNSGYMHRNWIMVDQFENAPFDQRHIQIKSYNALGDAELFVRAAQIPLAVYLASNGWYAVTVKGTFEKELADRILTSLKLQQSVPEDSFVTYGNTYVREVCCSGPNAARNPKLTSNGSLEPAHDVFRPSDNQSAATDHLTDFSALEPKSIEFVKSLYNRWSGDNQKAIAMLSGIYADRVRYYGKLNSREQVILDKIGFLDRWPDRVYRLRPGTIEAQCRPASTTCSITGTVDWVVRSVERAAQSTGVATFDIELDFASPVPLIVAESSQIVDRKVEKTPPISLGVPKPPLDLTLPFRR